MQTANVTSSSFPLVRSIYVTPSLIEARVPAEQLGVALAASDPAQLDALDTRKAAKLAKKWAPVIVHNLLADTETFQEEGATVLLERVEELLSKASGSAWASAFRRAGEQGVPPSSFIQSMPMGSKKVLHAERQMWKGVADQIEKELATWILKHRKEISRYFGALQVADQGYSVSLKKLAKYSIRA